jgi:hypothetical protein
MNLGPMSFIFSLTKRERERERERERRKEKKRKENFKARISTAITSSSK